MIQIQITQNGVWEAVVRLDDQRTTLPAIDLAGRALLGPALCLPYVPEAEPSFGRTRGADVIRGFYDTTPLGSKC